MPQTKEMTVMTRWRKGGATYQSQRQVQVRRSPNRYGEWVLSSIQEIIARLQTLEAKQNMEKERIKKLKPKLLEKAKALRNIQTAFIYDTLCFLFCFENLAFQVSSDSLFL